MKTSPILAAVTMLVVLIVPSKADNPTPMGTAQPATAPKTQTPANSDLQDAINNMNKNTQEKQAQRALQNQENLDQKNLSAQMHANAGGTNENKLAITKGKNRKIGTAKDNGKGKKTARRAKPGNRTKRKDK